MSKWDSIFIDGKRFEDNYQPEKFEWDRRHPHAVSEGLHCVNCLHADCSQCGSLQYPAQEVFVGITE